MVASIISGMRLAGLVAALPAARETVEDLAARFGNDAAERVAQATGIRTRHIASPEQSVTDLAAPAIDRLLDGLGWPAGSIDLLIVVTQTGEHVLPSTACLLQHRLGLTKATAAFDLNLGCSGFVYGLWNVGALLATSDATRALLVVGDLTSRLAAPDDRAVRPLFGDAVAVLALEKQPDAPPIAFDLGSDGAGAPYLIARRAAEPTLFMDGTQVFALTLREVPKSIAAALATAGWTVEQVDHFVLHQANAMMIRHLGPKIGAPPDKLVIALEQVGNTSSASIPLAMAQALATELDAGPRQLLISGFGVGWSWASAALTVGPLKICTSIEIA